jgi:hypothetical protein
VSHLSSHLRLVFPSCLFFSGFSHLFRPCDIPCPFHNFFSVFNKLSNSLIKARFAGFLSLHISLGHWSLLDALFCRVLCRGIIVSHLIKERLLFVTVLLMSGRKT